MSKRAPTLVILSALLFATGSASAAEGADPGQEAVHDQIRIMERSVTESSVTGTYTDKQRDAKLELLDKARARADQGDVDGVEFERSGTRRVDAFGSPLLHEAQQGVDLAHLGPRQRDVQQSGGVGADGGAV